MGLISWIRNKHYENKLARAIKLVSKANYDKAQDLLCSLLDKKPQAVVELSKLHILRATDSKSLVDILNKINELGQYVTDDNKTDYQKVLNGHIDHMHSKADELFGKELYGEAVLIVDALQPFIATNDFQTKVSRYHAYLSFSQSLLAPNYQKEQEKIIVFLKEYEQKCLNDIQHFVSEYAKKQRYVRAISLLIPFISTYSELKGLAVQQIVQVVTGKDFDNATPKKITDFVSDSALSLFAANELVRLSEEKANIKDYETSVLYDKFAAEFLSDDNTFNFNRCLHIVKDIQARVLIKEIASLLDLSLKLKLSNDQVNVLKDEIRKTVEQVINEHSKYIKSKENAKDFGNALISLNDIDYLLIKCQNLYDSGCDLIKSFYLSQKKQFIEKQIVIENFDRAKSEAESIVGIDEEAETLIAKTYYAKSVKLGQSEGTLHLYFDIVKLIDSGKLLSSFDDKKNVVLTNLKERIVLEYEQGDTEKAYSILDVISNQHHVWLPLYLELRTRDNKQIKSLAQQIKHAEDSIKVIITRVENLNIYTDTSIQHFWSHYEGLITKKTQSQPKDKAIDSLKLVRKYFEQYLHPSIAEDRIVILTQSIVKLLWSLANEYEADQQYDTAIEHYEKIKDEDIAAYNSRAELRLLICHLKANKMDSSLCDRANIALSNIKSHESLKDDLAYRLGLYFLKTLQPEQAESVFKKHLVEYSKELKDLCQNTRMLKAKSIVDKFNEKLILFANKSATSSMAEDLLYEINNNLDFDKAEEILGLGRVFSTYGSAISEYAVQKKIEEGAYLDALTYILDSKSNYVENSSVFHNLAVVALGAIENKQVAADELENCHENAVTVNLCIAICLTAFYTDYLFVKSLEHTSWDDSYTFTLDDSLGGTCIDDYQDAPDNLNEDAMTDKNISIRDVQKSLVSRLEVAVRKNYPDFEPYLNQQKSILEQLVDLKLDKPFTLICPPVASKNWNALNSVKSAMDYELLQHYGNEERVLALGVEFGFADDVYSAYRNAKNMVDKCKNILKSTVQNITSTYKNVNIREIKKYSELFSSLKAFISSDLNNAIQSKLDYSQFVDKYEQVCLTLDDSSLSMAYAQYANGEIVRRLNDDSMRLRDGALLLTRIYLVSSASEQVKENLKGVLSSFAFEVENKRRREDQAAMSKIKTIANTNTTVKSFVEEAEITAKLQVIVKDVNDGRMEEYDALDKVYKLYQNKTSHEGICKNLVQLCDICIMKYIVNDHYRSTIVSNILNNLNNNKSAVFNRHARQLAQSYNKIWNQLPASTKSLLQNGFSFDGSTLNSKGLALKKGLDFYKKLGNVVNNNSIFDIF